MFCHSEKGKALTTVHAKGKTLAVVPKSPERGADAAARALHAVLTSLEDSKAEDIVTIDIAGKSALGDFMVVVSGRSNRHVMAISDHLLTDLKDEGLEAPVSKVRKAAIDPDRHRRCHRPCLPS